MSRCRTYRYLLQPTVRQRGLLEHLLRLQCELYNAALEERRGAWRWQRRSGTYVDQCRTLTELRAVRPEVFVCGVVVCRGTLKRLDRAFGAFYRRSKAGRVPGFPRFRSVHRFDSVQWEDASGWRLDPEARRLRLLGIGQVKVHVHRPLRGTPKAITVKREGRHWWVSLRCVDVPAQLLPATGRQIGIDLGVCALVATSEGELVTEGRYTQKAAETIARASATSPPSAEVRARRQRAAQRLGRAHRRVQHQRKDLAHKLSRQLVNDYDLIVHEDLKITNMIRRPKARPDGDGGYAPNGAAAKAGLNGSISDSGWGQLLSMIAYKAEDAGREVIAVDPRHTSQRCAHCGHVAARNRVAQAEFRCQACGHQAHADVNAARNILRAGRAQQASACAG